MVAFTVFSFNSTMRAFIVLCVFPSSLSLHNLAKPYIATGSALRRTTCAPLAVEAQVQQQQRRPSKADYVKIAPFTQAFSIVATAGITAATTVEAIPSPLRLFALTYMVWSVWEYGFHRIAMHAKRFSAADEFFRNYNKLHILHHAETNGDMTMKEGFEPHGIYFSFKTSAGALLASVASIAGVAAVLNVPGLSAVTVVGASVIMTLAHGLLWNRLHSDSHAVKLAYADGLPTLWGLPLDYSRPTEKWLLDNHVGHHDIQAVGNFNIVLPGADHVFGTYWAKK
jgi:hypothetical protein